VSSLVLVFGALMVPAPPARAPRERRKS
jgi:hypothetical protein